MIKVEEEDNSLSIDILEAKLMIYKKENNKCYSPRNRHWEGKRKRKCVQICKGKTKRLAFNIKAMLDGIHCNTVILGRDLVIAFVFREHTQESYRIRILSKATTDPKYIEGELNQSSSRVDGTPPGGGYVNQRGEEWHDFFEQNSLVSYILLWETTDFKQTSDPKNPRESKN